MNENKSNPPTESKLTELLSKQTLGLQQKAKRNKKKNSVAHTIKKKCNFYNRFQQNVTRTNQWKFAHKDEKNDGEGRNSRKMKKMTKLEILASEILREYGFLFEHEFKLMGKYFDFKIYGHSNPAINEQVKKSKVLVETDGDYWHHKDSEVSLRQMRQSIEDRYKNTICIAKGYYLVRIWESEINKVTLRDKILEALHYSYPEIDFKSSLS